jgi:adenosylcobinamide kinase/adenosylcobinamide-phosphate guanylyltransferase
MLTFILGGARSGKSELALKLAATSGRDVLFVATMRELDDEMRSRVAAHRATRPDAWRTIEAPTELPGALREHAKPGGFVIVDCVTVWIANLLMDAMPDPDAASIDEADALLDNIAMGVRELCGWATAHDGDVAIVSNEVGSGIVPAYRLGRLFRDGTGAANKMLAAASGHAYYVLAGMALDLRALGAVPIDAVASDGR